MLNVERKELRRYSVWEQQELEAQELHFEDEEEPIPPSALLLGVSETAAAAIHRDLHKLYVKQGAPSNIGKRAHAVGQSSDSRLQLVSPFLWFKSPSSVVVMFYVTRHSEPLRPADTQRSSGGNGGGVVALLAGHRLPQLSLG